MLYWKYVVRVRPEILVPSILTFLILATVKTDDLGFNQAGESIVWATVLKRVEEVELNKIFFLNYHGVFMDDRLSVLLGLTDSDIKIARGDPRVDPLVMNTIADNGELLCAGRHSFLTSPTVSSVYANYSESQLPDVNDPDIPIVASSVRNRRANRSWI